MFLTILSQNVQRNTRLEGRWPGFVAMVRQIGPDIVCLQEADLIGGFHGQRIGQGGWYKWAARAAAPVRAPWWRRQVRRDLGMRLCWSDGRCYPVAVAWRPHLLFAGYDILRSDLMSCHGYCAARFAVVDGGPPLVVISTQLNPFSREGGAADAGIVKTRVWASEGVGMIIGDINHCPLGDPEPDWASIQPHNRGARCLPRASAEEPFRSDHTVARIFDNAGLTEVAGYLSDVRGDPRLRAVTSLHGGVRVDQAHVTPALVPALVDYQVIDGREFTGGPAVSDHHAILVTLDTSRIDLREVREYA